MILILGENSLIRVYLLTNYTMIKKIEGEHREKTLSVALSKIQRQPSEMILRNSQVALAALGLIN
jgi:hypothetical protein